MTKICSVVQNYYPSDPRIRKECEALIDNDYDVTVICLKREGEPVTEKIGGVKVHRLNLRKKRASKIRYLYEYLAFFLLAFIKLNQLDAKVSFDIVQVSNLPDFLIFTTVLQKIRGVRILMDMHEITPEFYMSKFRKKETSPLIISLKLIEKLSLIFADKVITVNDAIARILNERSIPRKEISIVMNTIDHSVIGKSNKNKEDQFNLVYHGHLDSMYGLDIAIEAVRELAKHRYDFTFYIFGNGPQSEDLRDRITRYGLDGQVKLMGRVSHVEMIDYLGRMHLGVLPIRKDVFTDLSFSNKIGEYIYLKIPVIVSDLATVQCYFSEREVTYFKSEDPVDLKNCIAFAYDHPEKMEQKALAAYETYRTMEWSEMRKRYLDAIRNLIN